MKQKNVASHDKIYDYYSTILFLNNDYSNKKIPQLLIKQLKIQTCIYTKVYI